MVELDKEEKERCAKSSKTILKSLSIIVIILILVSSLIFFFYDIDDDGISNYDEINSDKSDWLNANTDGDGFVNDGSDPRPNTYDPDEFVNAYQKIKNLDDEEAGLFMDIVLVDNEVSKKEMNLSRGINSIDNEQILNFWTGKMERLMIQHGFSDKQYRLVNLSKDLKEKGVDLDKISKSYFSDGELNESELKQLDFLSKEDYGLKDAFLDEDDFYGDNEKKYVKQLMKNPHGTNFQALKINPHEDGKITDQELILISDDDGDGLLHWKEDEIGTDDEKPDFDEDGIPDGIEVYGFQRKGLKAVPLDEYGADPLHKDIFIEVNGTMNFSEAQKEGLIELYDSFDVSNPDGEKGIDIHIDDDTPGYSMGGENLLPIDIPTEFMQKGSVYAWHREKHPRYGVFRFCTIEDDMSVGGSAWAPGYTSQVTENVVEDDRDEKFSGATLIAAHELGHNILGELDERSWWKGEFGGEYIVDKYHSNYTRPGVAEGVNYTYLMNKFPLDPYPRKDQLDDISMHENVVEELERDGLHGLIFSGKTRIDRSEMRDYFGPWKVLEE